MNIFVFRGSSLISSLCRFFYLFTGCVYIELFTVAGRAAFSVTAKRLLLLLALLLGIPCLMVWNHAGLFLDDLLFPLWRNAQVKNPLFIVGNARSGTTFLHRLLMQRTQPHAEAVPETGAAQAERMEFTTFRTWEIIFAVSVTWKTLFWQLWSMDNAVYRHVGLSLHTHVLRPLEAYLLGDAALPSSVHQVGSQQPEEDEWLMAHICLSQLLMFLFPLAGQMLNPIVFFDNYAEEGGQEEHGDGCAPLAEAEAAAKAGLILPTHIKNTVFHYYRDCVRRHMYFRTRTQPSAAEPGKQAGARSQLVFLSKNPPFTMRLQTLAQHFPDARLCVMLRDPMQSVPSMVSYIGIAWSVFASPALPHPRTADLIQFCKVHYQYPRRAIEQPEAAAEVAGRRKVGFAEGASSSSSSSSAGKKWPKERAHQCMYAELVRSPEAALQTMLRQLYPALAAGDSTSAARKSTAAPAPSPGPRYQSQHRYSVRSVCGMSAEQLRGQLEEASLTML